MSDVFISYSRVDKPFISALSEALKKSERSVWIDWQDIPPGAEFPQEIRTGIQEAENFIFVISPDSINSRWCLRELEHAVEHKKRIIPLLRRKVSSQSVPPAIRPIQRINFQDGDDFSGSLDTLIHTLDTDLVWVRQHTRLLKRAIEWEHEAHDDAFLLRGSDLQDVETWLAEASLGKEPKPTQLQIDYIQTSQTWQAQELKRWQEMYQKAISRQLAAQAELVRRQKPNLLPRSLLLAVESMRRIPSVEADATIRLALDLLPPPVTHSQHLGQVLDVAFSPDGQWIASGSVDGVVHVWDVANRREVSRIEHTARVSCVAFSRDGKWLATASSDQSACIWDAFSGHLLMRLGHAAAVTRVSFSPDSRYLLTISGSDLMPSVVTQGTVRVWETAAGKEVSRLAHSSMTAAAFSPDGTQIASASDHNQVIVWDALTGAISHKFPQDAPVIELAYHPDPALNWLVTRNLDGNLWVLMLNNGQFMRVDLGRSLGNALAISPQGDYLAAVDADHTVSVWAISEGKLQEEVARLSHDQPVEGLVFSPDGSQLASTSFYEKTVRLWRVRTGREIARIAQDQAIKAIFSADGRWLATASDSNAAWVWDIASPGAIGRLATTGVAGKLAFNPAGSRLVASGTPVPAGGLMKTTGQESILSVLEPESGHLIRYWQHADRIKAVAFDPKGELVACASQEHAWVWEVAGGRQIARLTHTGEVNALAFSQVNGLLATASDDKTARVWETSSGRELARAQHADRVLAVAFSPDGQRVASSSIDGTTRTWEPESGRELWSAAHSSIAANGWYLRLAFSPDGRWLASSAEPQRVQVWDAATGKAVARCEHQHTVVDMQFSPDSCLLVTTETDSIGSDSQHGTVRVWEPETGTEISRKQVENPAVAVAFSPDGCWIAAGLDDGRSLVWEALTGSEIVELHNQNAVVGVAFSPGGRWLACLGTEGDLIVALWRPEDIIAAACSRLVRDLSPDEWQQYIGEEMYRPVCPQQPSEV